MGLDVPAPVVDYGEEISPGTIIAGFDARVPVDAETCARHIASNMAFGFPEAVARKKLTVIANGPSALEADLKAIEGPTLALNGAMKLFMDQGVVPTYWAACDAQDIVMGFLPDNPPKETIYLVSSKCHPYVLARLADRDVRLWHLSDSDVVDRVRISTTSSVTMAAMWLLHRIGFTDFDVWGWDGCFMNGRHHASDASDWGAPELKINYGGVVENDEVIGGRTFATTRTWAAEANAAIQFFQLAKYFDIGLTIHGDGMFKHAREFVLGSAKIAGEQT